MTQEQATTAEKVPPAATCPQCQGAAVLLSPMKTLPPGTPVPYGCRSCGYAFTAGGKAFVEDLSQVRDIFRGGTLGHQTLAEMMKGEQLNPATQALFVAALTEYGLQMWMDGLKQGILLGALQAAKKE